MKFINSAVFLGMDSNFGEKHNLILFKAGESQYQFPTNHFLIKKLTFTMPILAIKITKRLEKLEKINIS